MKSGILVLVSMVLEGLAVGAGEPAAIPRWGIFELALKGPAEGNPFVDVSLTAVFAQQDRMVRTEGFYDGDGLYKIRFMPDSEGVWTYETRSNAAELNGQKGTFLCTAPAANRHGPVRVRNRYHFAYADGTPFFPFGTTLYKWIFQPPSLRHQTLQTLRTSPFNKVRFLLLPSVNLRNRMDPNDFSVPFEQKGEKEWDFRRPTPAYFQAVEKAAAQLGEMGIEAEVILFHPYDRGEWGLDRMTMDDRQFFLRYVIARLAAFANIWWSLANENAYIEELTDQDWDVLFQCIQENDPYGHLRSIHNAERIYNHTKPWVTHVSLQYYMAARHLGIASMLRDIYQKPIILDEINYEGNLAQRWGQLSGQEMVFRFWSVLIGGAYATHGEALLDPSAEGAWISTGGVLRGQSPPRIAFLRKIVESGPPDGLEPIDQYYETNIAGQPGKYYLIYFGKEPVCEWAFRLPDKDLQEGMRFRAERLDTWNMTIEPVEETFEVKKYNRYTYVDVQQRSISMPGKPYMALRLQRVE